MSRFLGLFFLRDFLIFAVVLVRDSVGDSSFGGTAVRSWKLERGVEDKPIVLANHEVQVWLL